VAARPFSAEMRTLKDSKTAGRSAVDPSKPNPAACDEAEDEDDGGGAH
jgi:hypothetical protein